jgi:hypothetical protein
MKEIRVLADENHSVSLSEFQDLGIFRLSKVHVEHVLTLDVPLKKEAHQCFG